MTAISPDVIVTWSDDDRGCLRRAAESTAHALQSSGWVHQVVNMGPQIPAAGPTTLDIDDIGGVHRYQLSGEPAHAPDVVEAVMSHSGLRDPVLLNFGLGTANWWFHGAFAPVASTTVLVTRDLPALRPGTDPLRFHQLRRLREVLVTASEQVVGLSCGSIADIPGAVYVGQGCDRGTEDLWADQSPEPADLALIPRPRVLCHGVASELVDPAAVEALADSGVNVVLAGFEPSTQLAALIDAHPRVHLLCPRQDTPLRDYLGHCQLGIIPYTDHPYTRSLEPQEVYDYSSAGLRSVLLNCAPPEALVPVLATATGSAEFVARCHEQLGLGRLSRDEIDWTRRLTWRAVARRILDAADGRREPGPERETRSGEDAVPASITPVEGPATPQSDPVLTVVRLGHQPDPAEASELGRVTNGLVSVQVASVAYPPSAQAVQQIAEQVSSPFVVLVDHPGPVDLRALLNGTSLLLANPGAVMAFGPPGGGTVRGIGSPEASGIAGGEVADPASPALIPGRLLLRQMTDRASNLIGLPENTVIRCTALRNRPSIPVRPLHGGAWYLQMWARLLAAGQVLYAPGMASGTRRTSEAVAISELAWWPFLLQEARHVRGLESDSDFRSAVAVYDRRYRGILERGLLSRELLAATAAARTRLLGDSHDVSSLGSGKLRVHVVVVGEDPWPHQAEIFGRAAKVSRVGAGFEHLLRGSSMDAALASSPLLPDALVEVVRRSSLPVLLLRSDECLEVADPNQFRSVLESLHEGNEIGVVRVAGGQWSRRILAGPFPGNQPPRARVVYSLILNAGNDKEWILPPRPDQLVADDSRFRRFFIAAHSYSHRSGGISVLHRMCDLLNRLGADARLLPLGPDSLPIPSGEPYMTNPEWNTPVAADHPDQESVVIYPEIVVGNPFGARNVVRWLLNRPGEITGLPMYEDPGDLQVAWDPWFVPDRPLVRLPTFDPRIFFPKDTPGEGGLLWVYKGRALADLERGGLVEILGTWPETKMALGALLRSASELVSCDWCSGLGTEAAMCATPVQLARGSHGRWSDSYVPGTPLGPPGLDQRPMVRVDGTPADGAADGSPTLFHAYLEFASHWADELSGFLELADNHFRSTVSDARRPVSQGARG